MKHLNKLIFSAALLCGAARIVGQVSPTLTIIPNKDFVVTVPKTDSTYQIASAVDKVNNYVYIAGVMTNTANATQDMAVIKYDYNGNIKWVRSYDHGSTDQAKAVAVDNSGNIYITGYSTWSGQLDVMTIKFDSTGTQQWAQHYNGTSNSTDVGLSIAVDGSGNSYVAGFSTETSHSQDYLTLKYNSAGTLSWAQKVNGTSNGLDNANKIVISGSNIFTTGFVSYTSVGQDIYTECRAASTGSLTWSRHTNGTSNSFDAGNDIKVKGSSIYIGGYITNTTTGSDYYFASLAASTGSVNYTANFDDGYNDADVGTSLTPDAYGNVAIVGRSNHLSKVDYNTVCYSNSGVHLWTNRFQTLTSSSYSDPKIATDTILHYFYVSGGKLNTNYDGALYQLDNNGNQNWIQYHDGAHSLIDYHTDIAMDGLGRVYLSGMNGTTASLYDITFIRYSQTPVYYPGDLDTAEKANPDYAYIQNMGQLINDSLKQETGVKFYTIDAYPSVYIHEKGTFLQFATAYHDSTHTDTVQQIQIKLLKRNPYASFCAYNPNPTVYNYYKGQYPTGIENVLSYNHIFRPNVYNNIDEHVSSNQYGYLQYFVVKPTGLVSDIQLGISNTTSLSINGSGNLEIKGINKTFTLAKPVLYQVDTASGLPYTIPLATGTFVLTGTVVTVSTPTFNTSLPLVVKIGQPAFTITHTSALANMGWNTYLGHNKMDENFGVDVDVNNDIYTCGASYSSYFYSSIQTITFTPSQGNLSGDMDAMLCKFEGSTKIAKWATYIGGSSSIGSYDSPTEIANTIKTSDYPAAGGTRHHVFIAGRTASTNFPVGKNSTLFSSTAYTVSCSSMAVGTPFTSFIAGFQCLDGKKIWSTALHTNLLPGEASSIDINGDGEILVSGWNRTQPSGSTMVGIYPYVTPSGGYTDTWGNGYFMYLDTSFTVQWSSAFGSTGGGMNQIKWYERDLTTKYAFMVGRATESVGAKNLSVVTNTAWGYNQSAYGGGFSDGYISVLDFSNYSLTYSSWWGGNNEDEITNVLFDKNNYGLYLGGYSRSTDLDTSKLHTIGNPNHRVHPHGFSDALLMYFEGFPAAYSYRWGTLFGGPSSDDVTGLTIDGKKNIYVTGETKSTDSLVTSLGSFYNQSLFGNQSGADQRNAYLGYFNSNMDNPWLTYMSGYNRTRPLGIVWAPNNKLYLAGGTQSKEDTYPDVDFNISSTLDYYRSNYTADNTPVSSTTQGFIQNYFGFNSYTPGSARDGSNDNYGPLTTDGFVAEFSINPMTVGIHEIKPTANEFMGLYPNPCTDGTYLSIKGNQDIKSISILNELGQTFREIKPNGSNLYYLPTSGLADGMYFVNVKTSATSGSLKFIKR